VFDKYLKVNDNVLVVSLDGKSSSTLYPYLIFANGQISKLAKLDLLDFPQFEQNPLKENEVFLVSM